MEPQEEGFTREQIVSFLGNNLRFYRRATKQPVINVFLERCVFKTLTHERYPDEFGTIINALKTRYINSEKFSDETLQKITAIKVDRDYNKRLQVEVQYDNKKRWHKISWTKMYDTNSRTAKQPSQHSKVVSAFRHEIKDQILKYNSTRFGIRKCQVCDTTKNLEVDHTKPNTFSVLFQRFLTEAGISEADIKVYWSGGSYVLCDQGIRDGWSVFHETNATFRLLCGDCNKKNWRRP
jgi:hypothetical protein